MNNGGCSTDAMCFDAGGTAQCVCRPGFTGPGTTCTACSMCDSASFASTMCSPLNDTVCMACRPSCDEGQYESTPCGPFTDRTCSQCSFCGQGFYTVSSCAPQQNTVCAPCAQGCLSCSGLTSCFVCDTGYVLGNGVCVPAVCGNAVVESGEQCDDGNSAIGDGCNANCMVEGGNYCFGEPTSTCRAGACVVEPGGLPLGSDFALDGAASPVGGGGLQLTQRSTIYTTAKVRYPVVVEATVVYSGFDITYAGTRGDGLRDTNMGGEPTDALRARLSVTDVELTTGPGTQQIASTTPTFSPSMFTPYRVRFVDDGFMATVEWFNPVNPSEHVVLPAMTSYHGSDDRAFVGGGDMGAVTVSDIRVCSAPPPPVMSGIVAHYSAIPSWTVGRDMFGSVSMWQDLNGNMHPLSESGPNPGFVPNGVFAGGKPAVDFMSGARLATSPYMLTTDVSVFAVVHHRASAQFGAIAHHGDRDNDWSMEQNGSGNGDALHWQTNNDNTNMNLTLTNNTSYVMAGIFNGTAREFSATPLDGSTPLSVSINDASHTITSGTKPFYVGSSNVGEASNTAIGELIYFNRALNTSERDAVISYLRAMWRP